MPRGPAPHSISHSIEGSGRVSQVEQQRNIDVSRNIPHYSGRKYLGPDEYEMGLGGGSSRKNAKFIADPAHLARNKKVNPPVWWG